ncbi:MAG: hypothetical protein HQ559_10725 [Lentisphaerae bacterium]|nr:hypothetical protein [Lentisphaerota bacterium]
MIMGIGRNRDSKPGEQAAPSPEQQQPPTAPAAAPPPHRPAEDGANSEERTAEVVLSLLQRLQAALPVGFDIVGDLLDAVLPPVVQIRAPRGAQNTFAVVDEALARVGLARVDMRTYQEAADLMVLVNGCHVPGAAEAEEGEES